MTTATETPTIQSNQTKHKPRSKPLRMVRAFYDFSQRRLGMQVYKGNSFGKAKYLPSIALQNVTMVIESNGIIDGENVGMGGFLHGKMLDRSQARIRLVNAVAIHWNGHQFVTSTGQAVKAMKMAFVIDNSIIGYGISY